MEVAQPQVRVLNRHGTTVRSSRGESNPRSHMSRRIPSLLVVLCLVAVACTPGDDTTVAAAPTRAPTTTTTSTLATTTTTESITIAGAPDGLVAQVEAFYAYALGATAVAPPMPAAVLASIAPVKTGAPRSGVASVGDLLGQSVATVEMGTDLFLAVDDGGGWRIVGGQWPSLSIPTYFGQGPRLVAVVGSDARPGQAVARTRADSIHFVGLDGNGSGAVVGVPRDSYVPVPGRGKTKINSSLSSGGPETMMATFGELTGLPFEGYVITGFSGFTSLLGDVLGGVTLDVPFAISDRWAHVSLSAGVQLLTGAQALGFARARKTVPGGDLTRSGHQGVILIAAAQAVQALGYGALPRLLESSEPHIVTNLTPEQLLTFSAMVISADLDSVINVVAPGSPGSAGGASVVYLSKSVSGLWADLADGRIDG